MKLNIFFGQFCTKHHIPFRSRKAATNSHYIEVEVGNKVMLVRFADHDAGRNPWTPDFDIRTNGDLKRLKKHLKELFAINKGALHYAA